MGIDFHHVRRGDNWRGTGESVSLSVHTVRQLPGSFTVPLGCLEVDLFAALK